MMQRCSGKYRGRSSVPPSALPVCPSHRPPVSVRLTTRPPFSSQISARTKAGQFGANSAEEAAETERRREFAKAFLPATKAQLQNLTQGYQVGQSSGAGRGVRAARNQWVDMLVKALLPLNKNEVK